MENIFIKRLDGEREDYLKIDVLMNILNRDDSVEIIKEIFSELTKKNYFKDITEALFDYFLRYIADFQDELYYLLSNGYIKIEYLSVAEIEVIIYNCPEGIDEILKYFEKLNLRDQGIVTALTRYVIDCRQEKFSDLINTVIESRSWDAINGFINELAFHDEKFDYNLIIEALRERKIDYKQSSFSSIPYTLADYTYLWVSDNLRDFIVSNFEELFEYEKENKMSLYINSRRFLPKYIKSKYDYLSKIYGESPVPPAIEKSLNIMLEHKAEDFIKDFIGDKEVKYKGIGSTSQVFRVGEDKILKISKIKHIEETITRHFLLAPTEMKVIYDANKNPVLYMEKQDLLSQTYNGIPISKEDIENYFLELARCGLILRDPLCIRRRFDNFGFLNDYHDATLVGVRSHDELPDWFKKRPLVLWDIDMVTRKLQPDKRKL